MSWKITGARLTRSGWLDEKVYHGQHATIVADERGYVIEDTRAGVYLTTVTAPFPPLLESFYANACLYQDSFFTYYPLKGTLAGEAGEVYGVLCEYNDLDSGSPSTFRVDLRSPCLWFYINAEKQS